MADFAGFGPKALSFFKGLKREQSKAWFEKNRSIYENDVMTPMLALLGDLTASFAASSIPLRADGKKSIFRIYRDVRFSRDKSPYKTHCGAVMNRSASKNENGLLYIHVGADGCFVAAGFHMPEPSDLAALRKAIVAKPKAFTGLEGRLAKGNLALGTESQLTRLPRGFEAQKGGPVDGALRLKSFIVEQELSAKDITAPTLVATIADFASRSLPLLSWGWAALAP